MSELPDGWETVSLGELGEWGSGGTPKRTNPRYYEGGMIPWLIIGDLNDGTVYSARTYITEDGLLSSSTKLLPINTLLIAMYGSIGKLGITGVECATNQAIAFCKPDTDVVSLRYLFHCLMESKNALVAQGQGGAQQNISQGILKAHLVPLAPLKEQKRIADKLDVLIARVDACRERLDRVPLILKRFRQAVFAAATSGQLTENWQNSRDNQASSPIHADSGAAHELAGQSSDARWQETLIGDLLVEKPRNGYSPRAVEFETATRSLTLTATTSGRFNSAYFKYIDKPIPKDSHLWLKPGDILIQRANTLEYVGVSAIYDGPPSGYIYPDLMMKCRPNSKVLTKFLYYLLSSDNVRSYFRANATGTAGNMPKINQQIVISALVRVPSINEQHEIVHRVEALFAFADRLENRCKTAHDQVEQLTPMLLAKAFRGELVRQDPSDEPASVLLERLRAIWEAQPAQTKKVSTRKKPTMTKMTKESIREAIHQLPKDKFSFDELRETFPGDYDSLKEIVFALLSEGELSLTQIFDQEVQAMRFVRGNR